MTDDQKVKFLTLIGLPTVIIIFYVTASLHFSYTPDDTYIYLRYARNILHGDGMSFNPGEPTYGFTSPLWLLLVTLGGKMGIDLYIAAKVMDLFLASVSIALFYLLAYEMLRDRLTAFFAVVVFASNAWFIRWAGTGMETSLAVFLALLTFWYCIRNEYILSTVFATLLTLTRPETFMIMGIILIDLYNNSHNKKRAFLFGIELVIFYGVFLLPWLLYAYFTFGRFFPNTGMAKAGLNFDIQDIIYTLADAVGTIGLTDGVAAACLLIFAFFFFFRMKARTELSTEQSMELLAERFFIFRNFIISFLWIVSIILFYSFTGVNVVSRYLLPLIPLIIIAALLLIQRVLSHSFAERIVKTALIIVTLLMVTQNQVVYHRIVLPRAEAFERSMMEYCFIPIGKWLRDNTPEGTTVVAPDIGAIGYYSDRKIFDSAGLISHEVIPLLHEGNTPYQIIEYKLYKQFCTPSYVVHNADKPYTLADKELEPVMTKMVGSLRVFETAPTYYSLYRVHDTEIK